MSKSWWQKIALYIVWGILLLQILSLVKIVSGREPPLEYIQFVEKVKQKEVQDVRLSANPEFFPAALFGTQAFIKTKKGQMYTANISSNSSGLIKLLISHVDGNIEIPATNNYHIWVNELSRLSFPLLAVIALALLILPRLSIVDEKILVKIRLCVYFIVPLIAIIFISDTFLSKKYVAAINPISYAQFIQEIQGDKIGIVGLLSDRSRAVVDSRNGNRGVVNLPPDDKFKNIITQSFKGKLYTISDNQFNDMIVENNRKSNRFQTYIQPKKEGNVWFRAFSGLFPPLSLLVGLFFVIYRVQKQSR